MPNENKPETYVLEAIEGVIRRKGCILYRCKWKNYEERTDEPWDNIGRFKGVLEKTTGEEKEKKKKKSKCLPSKKGRKK